MQSNYLNALSRVLTYEGGEVNDPRDPGGKTNQGITQSTFTAYLRSKSMPYRDVFTMTDDERDDIYETQYWNAVQGAKLPAGVDLVVFDGAVNSGPAQSIKWLQSALGHGLVADGVLGAKTLEILDPLMNENSADMLIRNICSRRLAFCQSLSTWSTFGQGWSARIANVQKTALLWEMGAHSSAPLAPDLSGVKGNAKAPVSQIKPPVVAQVEANIITGASAVATIATQAAQSAQPFVVTFAWAEYVFGALTLVGMGAGVIAFFASKAHDRAVAGTATAEVDPRADAKLPALPDVKVALKGA
jgi:lysozyme family protein